MYNRRPKEGHSFAVTSVKWYGKDTGMFFTGSFDRTVKVWDTNTATAVLTFSIGHAIHSLDVSNYTTIANPNAKQSSLSNSCLIAVGCEDPKIRICDLRSKTPSHTLVGHNDQVKTVKWYPRNDYLLASGSRDGTIRLWDIRRGGCLVSLDQHNKPGTSVVMNNHVAVTDGRSWTASAHTGSVNGLCFTPDSNFLLSAGSDARMRCWEVQTGLNTMTNFGQVRTSSKSSAQFVVSNNGQLIFCPVANSIQVIEFDSGKQLRKLLGHFDRVTSLAYHPIEQELYSGSLDGQIQVWCPAFDEIETEVESDQDRWSDEDESARDNNRYIN